MISNGNNKVKILLADQQHMFRHGLASVLSKERDIDIIGEAANTDEILEKVTTLLPDVVILDITMSSNNSLEMVKSYG